MKIRDRTIKGVFQDFFKFKLCSIMNEKRAQLWNAYYILLTTYLIESAMLLGAQGNAKIFR